jgi:hypothetical protein|tara:strand:+ start:89 stop:370 length:282 start_codon:yes stop_codon:yes gene_type:complete
LTNYNLSSILEERFFNALKKNKNMIQLTFNTSKHTLLYRPDIEKTHVREYPNVTTIKDTDKYYEVRQKQITTGASVPIIRVPIKYTIIEYIHE